MRTIGDTEGIDSFEALYADILRRDPQEEFLHTGSGASTYADLVERVDGSRGGGTPLDFIADMFRTRLDGEVLVLSDYTLTEEDLELCPDVIISTSGTHHRKHVMHREESIFRNIQRGNRIMGLLPSDRMFSLMPFNHIFGLQCGLLAPLMIGSRIMVPSSPFSALDDMAAMMPTFVVCLPELLGALPGCIRPRRILMGGAPLPSDLPSAPQGAEVFYGYGSTECLSVSVGPLDGSSCGHIIEGYKVSEDLGELVVEGDIMIGYTSSPPLSGPFRTGDSGHVEDGMLFVTGRRDGVIIFDNGFKVNADELREVALSHRHVTGCTVECDGDGIRIVLECTDAEAGAEAVDALRGEVRPVRVTSTEVRVHERQARFGV